MAAPQNLTPIIRGLVRTRKANTSLKDALAGGMWEGVAPLSQPYPLLTYGRQSGSDTWFHDSLLKRPGYNIAVWDTDLGQARNLDQLVLETLWDADLGIDQQSTVLCRRVMDLSSTHVDGSGDTVFQVGGIYEIWADQDL